MKSKHKIWTVPNVLTFIRILFIPFILVFLWQDKQPALLIALILYILSAITDTLDGMLARALHQESDLGAYLDPLADKILINTMFIVFALNSNLYIGWWAFILFMARDIFVTQLRNIASKKGIKFQTSFFAKAKTSSQMLTVAYILIYMNITRFLEPNSSIPYFQTWSQIDGLHFMIYTSLILTIIAILLTLASGIDYGLTYLKALKKASKNYDDEL